MITKGLVIDTETGGLDPRLSPLLSISLLAFETANVTELSEFYLKIMPPRGTLLQVPVDPASTAFNPPVAYLEDSAGDRWTCDLKGNPTDPSLQDALIITAGAARVNGFTWEGWKGHAVPLVQADNSFKAFIDQWFETPPVAFAHNAAFDDKFVSRAFPGTHGMLRQPWLCTMELYRKYLKDNGLRGSAKLGELAKTANEDTETPVCGTLTAYMLNAHDALADTRMCLGAIGWLAAKMGKASVFPTELPPGQF
jgi:DNA polymerase III epsilon subunit-like protein